MPATDEVGGLEKPRPRDMMERLKEVPDRLKKAPAKQYGKVGAGLVLGGIAFGWLAFPFILDFAVSKIVNLSDGSDVRKIWKRIPQYLDFNVYIFNITNPDEVQNGGTPVLQEIGPYRYRELKEKVNLMDDPIDDTISYNSLNTWYFLEKESAPLTGDELVVVPHLPVLSVLLVAEQDFPTPMMTVVNAALPKLYGKLSSLFMVAKVRELLFEGILIDCRAKEILPKTVCIAIKQNSKPLVKLPNNRYLFSFFGIRNATPEDLRITVKKGVRDVYEIGKVVALNGKPENFAYPEGECNKLVGTDSTIFPPFRTPDNHSVKAFSPEICRAMAGIYEGEGSYEGVTGHTYVVSLGDMKGNPAESCYCNRKCLDKGAVDLTKCIGAPIIATLPHFYDSDPKFLEGVVGLKPDKQKHQIVFIMEPTSGVPLLARKRIQFNIHLHPIRYVNLTKNLKPTLLPIFWLEENLDLGGELMGFLEANLLTNLRLVDILKWSLIVIGIGVCVGGVVLHRMRKEEEKKKATSREELLGTPEELNPSRLSLGSSPASSKMGSLPAPRQVWPEPGLPERLASRLGEAVESSAPWRMTPVESLPTGFPASAPAVGLSQRRRSASPPPQHHPVSAGPF